MDNNKDFENLKLRIMADKEVASAVAKFIDSSIPLVAELTSVMVSRIVAIIEESDFKQNTSEEGVLNESSHNE